MRGSTCVLPGPILTRKQLHQQRKEQQVQRLVHRDVDQWLVGLTHNLAPDGREIESINQPVAHKNGQRSEP